MSINGKRVFFCMFAWCGLSLGTGVHAIDSLNNSLDPYWLDTDVADEAPAITEPFESILGSNRELWLNNKWGLQGSLYSGDLDNTGINDAEYLSLDVKRRFLNLTEKTFFAVGVGWQDIDLHIGGASSGPRVLLEGRWGLNDSLSLYGATAWLPYLDDISAGSNVVGSELEAGLTYEPLPYLSLRAGYRRFDLDYDNSRSVNRNSSSSGLMLGAGIRF